MTSKLQNYADPENSEEIFTPSGVAGFPSQTTGSANYSFYQNLTQLYEVLTVEQEEEIVGKYCDAQEAAVAIMARLVYPVRAYLAFVEKVDKRQEKESGGRVSEITVKLAMRLLEICDCIQGAANANTREPLIKDLERELVALDYKHIARLHDTAADPVHYSRCVWMSPDRQKVELAKLHAHIAAANFNSELLFKHNIRLFIKVAHEFAAHPQMRQHRDDMVQEGAMGLICAIQKYSRGMRRHDGGNNKLSGWAIQWIKHYIRRWADKMSHSIRRPVRKSERLRRLVKAISNISPPLDIEDIRGMKDEQIAALCKRLAADRFTVKEIIELRDSPATVSINTPVGDGDGGGVEMGDFLAEEKPESGYVREGDMDKGLKIDMVTREIEKLDIVTQLIIASRFGIGSGPRSFFNYAERELERFAEESAISVERVTKMGDVLAPAPAELVVLERNMKLY